MPTAALTACDADVFPNIHVLLRIACTLPVSFAETERCNSSLKRLKTYFRSTMGADPLSSLALMQVHRTVSVDFEKVVSVFAEKHPRRIALRDPLFDQQRGLSPSRLMLFSLVESPRDSLLCKFFSQFFSR